MHMGSMQKFAANEKELKGMLSRYNGYSEKCWERAHGIVANMARNLRHSDDIFTLKTARVLDLCCGSIMHYEPSPNRLPPELYLPWVPRIFYHIGAKAVGIDNGENGEEKFQLIRENVGGQSFTRFENSSFDLVNVAALFGDNLTSEINLARVPYSFRESLRHEQGAPCDDGALKQRVLGVMETVIREAHRVLSEGGVFLFEGIPFIKSLSRFEYSKSYPEGKPGSLAFVNEMILAVRS
ncbi:MAG: hypothetical protein Q7T16_03530 [Candidatus Burarchaeum sp.]|nr:hypothetical protein [Candidatus Burarchaeum sp.]MDO8339702.1 hypothetical protein [Candidatus Burarchaeum sp.]